MKKFTKVYKAPGYPVDPKLEEERVWARKWQFPEFIHQDPRETGGLFAGLDKAVAWKEIDEAVRKAMMNAPNPEPEPKWETTWKPKS